MKKLQNTAKGLDTALKISFWGSAFAAALLCVGVVVLCVLGFINPGAVTNTSRILDFGMIRFTMDPNFPLAPNDFLKEIICVSITSLAQVVVFCLFILCARRILAAMIQGQFFHNAMSRQLRHMGWLTICLGVIQNISKCVVFPYLLSGYDLDALFLGAMINGYELQFDLELTFLFWSCVLFLLSYVFAHGYELQQLSDETL